MNGINIRDIHLPELYGWWPPALGWWLILLILLFVIFGLPWLRQKWKRRSVDQLAADQFLNLKTAFENNADKQLLLEGLSVLLRRICMTYATRKHVASLLGDAWVTHLDTLVGKTCFTPDIVELLITGPYQNQPDFDADELLQCSHEWFQALPYNKGTHQ